ncbi:unnamed protein product [Symbiodinium sp. CCMP2592]|nr:unnamed protein product [Symbiodinium sp. CCMP2592]
MAWGGSSPMLRPPRSRLLCLYGTDFQRQKLRFSAGRRRSMKPPPEAAHSQNDLFQVVFEVLGKSWLQEILGCSRVPHALSKDIFHVLFLPDEPKRSFFCLNCRVHEKLHRALRHLQITRLETERRTEALEEQYASVRKHVTTVQRRTCGEVDAKRHRSNRKDQTWLRCRPSQSSLGSCSVYST